jgi:hypothetical protein
VPAQGVLTRKMPSRATTGGCPYRSHWDAIQRKTLHLKVSPVPYPLKCRLFCQIALECGWLDWQRLSLQKTVSRIGTGGGRAEARPYNKTSTPESVRYPLSPIPYPLSPIPYPLSHGICFAAVQIGVPARCCQLLGHRVKRQRRSATEGASWKPKAF